MTTTGGTTSRSSRARLRRGAIWAAVLGVGLALAGCSADSADSGAPMQDEAGDAPQAEAPAGGDGAVVADDGDAASVASSADRMVIKNGEIYLAVEDPAGAAHEVAAIVERLGGRVDSREIEAASDTYAGSAVMTVRVPAGSLDDAVDRLGELGEVSRYTDTTKDVTDAVVDLDARIEAAEVSVDRVQEFLERAADTDDLLATERELATRQGELESLRAQRATLADQVAMSTLYVSLTAPGDPVIEPPGPRTFADGLGVGWESLWRSLRVLAVGVGVLLPWLALAGVIAAAFVVPLRLRRRPRPAPTPPTPPTPTPTPPTATP